MPEVVETAIKGLDVFLGGGLMEGSCILLMAPPNIEARLLCLEFIYRGIEKGQPGIIVTMDDSPESLKQKAVPYGWVLLKGEDEGTLKWVDGYSIHSDKEVQSTPVIKRVGGPMALTDTSIAISQLQAELHGRADNYRFVFDSLSTLLIYNSPETVHRFLEVIVSKIRNSKGVGIFTLGEGMHDQKVEMTMRHAVDGAIRLTDKMDLEVLSLPTPGARKKAKLELFRTGFEVRSE